VRKTAIIRQPVMRDQCLYNSLNISVACCAVGAAWTCASVGGSLSVSGSRLGACRLCRWRRETHRGTQFTHHHNTARDHQQQQHASSALSTDCEGSVWPTMASQWENPAPGCHRTPVVTIA